MDSHLLLPGHVTYVHRALGKLGHHEDGGHTLPLRVGHNGEVGGPRLKMLGTERMYQGACRAFPGLSSSEPRGLLEL